jgi:alkylated DNA repair dioxygenase AlkB
MISRPVKLWGMPTAASAEPRRLEAPGLALRHWPAWLLHLAPSAGLAIDALERHLRDKLPWEQPTLSLHGRQLPAPRLCCWVADPSCAYRYSGQTHQPRPWSPPLQQLRQLLQHELGWRFNSVLLNRYRNGDDAMGWHADDEAALQSGAPIASLSLGASRSLRFRPTPGGAAVGQPTLALDLADGDLLVMDPPTQRNWQHALPRRRRAACERINLTFRTVQPS